MKATAIQSPGQMWAFYPMGRSTITEEDNKL